MALVIKRDEDGRIVTMLEGTVRIPPSHERKAKPSGGAPTLDQAVAAVAAAGGNRARAARALGVDRHKFYHLLGRNYATVQSAAPTPLPVVRKVAFVRVETAQSLATLRRQLAAHFDREINEADVAGKILDRAIESIGKQLLAGKEWAQ